ncbi:hypothetical protein OSB04_002489 [Centaurea solstitialis]|uniref:Uncharacterized protein n=1 Tax=Centaurea solstitialis TaxID=347529 RepID=A0AA38U0L1_9ASTR|nr:hypothetical protein OSB04_002489 [Centaurea solstitialis]
MRILGVLGEIENPFFNSLECLRVFCELKECKGSRMSPVITFNVITFEGSESLPGENHQDQDSEQHFMKSKRNLIPIHYLSLHDLRETVTFDGINFHDWNHALKAILKNDDKLYILKVPVPEQPPPTSRTDHDDWWKHKCDVEDVSEIIMGTVIPDLQKIFDTDDAYKMYRQMTQIYQQLIIKCFKPVETLDAYKVDGSYTVCSKRPMVQNKEKYKRRKTKKAPKMMFKKSKRLRTNKFKSHCMISLKTENDNCVYKKQVGAW